MGHLILVITACTQTITESPEIELKHYFLLSRDGMLKNKWQGFVNKSLTFFVG